MKRLSNFSILLMVCMIFTLSKLSASSTQNTQGSEEAKGNAQGSFSTSLSDSYYTVGEQYDKCGKKIKGESFKRMAKEKNSNCTSQSDFGDKIIVKTLNDQQKKDLLGEDFNVELREAQEKGTSLESLDELTQKQIAQLQFNRFVRALLCSNLPLLEKLLAPVIKLNEQELEKSDLLAAFDHAFSQVDFQKLSPKDLYKDDITKVKVLKDEEGPFVEVEAIEREDLQTLPFWRKLQRFYFKPNGKQWLLVKIEARS